MNEIPHVAVLLGSIAQRLNAIVPSGFRLEVDGPMVWFGGSGSYAGEAYDMYLDLLTSPSRILREDRDPIYEPATIGEVIAAVAFKIMDELKDEVDQSTRDPWPGERTVPKANAVVEQGALFMWYGDREGPAVACEPLPLTDLVASIDDSDRRGGASPR